MKRSFLKAGNVKLFLILSTTKTALWSNWIDKVPQGFLWWFESTRCLKDKLFIKVIPLLI